jgi:Flp pilus assembly protein TadB
VRPADEVIMVPVTSLWLPILVSAVIVFVASSIIHMAFKYHHDDWKRLPSHDDVQEAMRRFNVPPGDYHVRGGKGPTFIMTIMPPGQSGMGKNLVMWFLYSILVSVFAGYVAGAALGPGVMYLRVFQFAGTVAFCGYSLALLQHSIWYNRKWRTTLVSMFDGLIYGLLTAGTFGWLWPR